MDKNDIMNNRQSKRRSFIKQVAYGTLAAGLSVPCIVSAASAVGAAGAVKLENNDVIVFQGDSITDAGRDKKITLPDNAASLGAGYALMATSHLLAKAYEKNLQVYNKGISGNKVFQLADRWDADCLSLKPNVLSILVGVNDFWHTLTHGYTGDVNTYFNDYDHLLARTRAELPQVKFIIGEPFAIMGVKSVDEQWYPKFDAYRKAAYDLAKKHNAVFIPYQEIFDRAVKTAPPAFWTIDGVHPSVAGLTLMADAWLKAVKW